MCVYEGVWEELVGPISDEELAFYKTSSRLQGGQPVPVVVRGDGVGVGQLYIDGEGNVTNKWASSWRAVFRFVSFVMNLYLYVWLFGSQQYSFFVDCTSEPSVFEGEEQHLSLQRRNKTVLQRQDSSYEICSTVLAEFIGQFTHYHLLSAICPTHY